MSMSSGIFCAADRYLIEFRVVEKGGPHLAEQPFLPANAVKYV